MSKIDYQANPQERWLVNEGEHRSNNFSLKLNNIEPIKMKWADVNWSIGASYQKATTNQTGSDYTQRTWGDYDVQQVIVKDELKPIEETPATQFNQPWSAYARLDTHFPSIGLNWSQRLNYQSGYREASLSGMRCSAKIAACGGYNGIVAKYEEVKYPNHFTVDWLFEWKKKFANEQELSVNLTALNVLNKVIKVQKESYDYGNTYYQTYLPGRQFWLGAKYSW